MSSRCIGFAVTTAAILLGAGLPGASHGEAEAPPAAKEVESCIRCHADPDFLVTHPKLYEYYRDWERSIHGQEGVTCFDCHGGDPDTDDAQKAHAEFAGPKGGESAVAFSKVHETCGDCHEEILEAYRKSQHFEKVKEKKGDRHGPTCVTCHRSMNTMTLDVTSVETACARCHNAETGIEADVPDEARAALNRFLSIDRFHRYVAARLEPDEAGRFFQRIDGRIEALSVLWHTFDLERIDRETQAVIDAMRAKRDEIRERPRD